MVKVGKKYVKISCSENPSNLKRQSTMASQTGSLSLVMFYLRKRYAAMTSTPSFFIIHHQTLAFWLFLNLIYRTMRRCLLNQKPWADQWEKVIKQLRLVDMVIKQLNWRTSVAPMISARCMVSEELILSSFAVYGCVGLVLVKHSHSLCPKLYLPHLC